MGTRGLPTMVVDTADRSIVMFGGSNGTEYHSDVWELLLDTLEGYSWLPVRTGGTLPPGRSGHTAIYDPVGHQMVIFAGRAASGKVADVWSFNLATDAWQQLSPSGVPPGPRAWHTAAYCPTRHSMVVVDGRSDVAPYDEVYELLLDSMKWRLVSVGGSHPTPRWGHAMEYDPTSNRMIVFGGENAGGVQMNDVWALDLAPGSETWTELSTSGQPPSLRAAMASCFDAEARKFFIFGGSYYPGYFIFYNDLHVLDLGSLLWTELYPSGSLPTERRCAAGAYDFSNRNFVVFAGQSYYDWENDTYYVGTGSPGASEWQPATPKFDTPSLFVPSVASCPVRLRYFLSGPGEVKVRVIDVAGRVVRQLLDGKVEGQTGWLEWDGTTDSRERAPAGTYVGYLEAAGRGAGRRFTLAE